MLISVIVTTYKSDRTLTKCLKSIADQSYKNFEIIVVDSSPTENDHQIAMDFNCRYVRVPFKERSEKRNYGVKTASGDWVAIIDSDMILNSNVLDLAFSMISNAKYKALCVPEKSIGMGYVARLKSIERDCYINVDWMQAARFFERKIFLDFGGYDPTNVGSEDYTLPRNIEYRYGPDSIGTIPSIITQDEGDLKLTGLLKKKLYYSKAFVNYSSNDETEKSFKKKSSFYNRIMLYIESPIARSRPDLLIAMILLKFAEFGSMFVGFIYYKYLKRTNKT
ncbi:MAG: hypothetical protein EoVTN8_399 [Fluviibacter phosphoraccumulans EoVTN8]